LQQTLLQLQLNGLLQNKFLDPSLVLPQLSFPLSPSLPSEGSQTVLHVNGLDRTLPLSSSLLKPAASSSSFSFSSATTPSTPSSVSWVLFSDQNTAIPSTSLDPKRVRTSTSSSSKRMKTNIT